MNTTQNTFLSPEDRKSYQKELIDKLLTRNHSLSSKLAKEWVALRLEAGGSLDEDGLKNPQGMEEQIKKEMLFAGLEIISAAHKGVQS